MLEIEQPRRKRKPETTKRRCYRCHGTGQSACQSCGGSGKIATSRNVFGAPQFTRCTGCFGNKTRRCLTCAGVGYMV